MVIEDLPFLKAITIFHHVMWTVPWDSYNSVFKSTALASCLHQCLQGYCSSSASVNYRVVYTVWQCQKFMWVKSTMGVDVGRSSMVGPTYNMRWGVVQVGGGLLYKRGLMWEPYTTTPLDCEVGKHWFQAVSLPDEWRVALIWYPGKLQPMHRKKHVLVRSH